jgi:NADH:ubiquinone oxidoreductase subunit
MLKFLTNVQSSVSVRLTLWLSGTKVGADDAGNIYYTLKPKRGLKRERRLVIYATGTDASAVPAEWHGWMHHQTDAIPSEKNPYRRVWQKPNQANLTGTTQAYVPPGHTLRGGQRESATGDYIAWSPSKE